MPSVLSSGSSDFFDAPIVTLKVSSGLVLFSSVLVVFCSF